MNKNWELMAVRNQLKKILKQKKVSYKNLAKEMNTSEITVKRFFTSDDISFIKLQNICGVVDISALELISLVNKGGEETFNLTLQQEKDLSQNEQLYDFFVLLLKFRSIKHALQNGQFKKENIPKFLRELEKLDLIEFPIDDKVHVKRMGVLTWIKGGPLQKKFMRVRHMRYLDAFESQLDEKHNYLASSQRHLRAESLEEMKRDLDFIIHKYRARAYREETIDPEDQLIKVAWLVGLGKYNHFE